MQSLPVINVALICCNQFWKDDISYSLESLPGYKLIAADTENDNLLQSLRHANKRPSLCIIDASLGKLKNMRLIHILRSEWPGIKIALLLTHFDWEVFNTYRNIPDGLLLKSETPEKFKNDLDNIFFKQYLYSDEIFTAAANTIVSYGISKRHLQFLKLCCTNLTYHEIAEKMEVSVRTVDGYRDHLFKQFNVTNKTSMVLYGLKHKHIFLEDINI